MKWIDGDNDTIRRNWKKCSDTILASMIGVSRDVLRTQRCKLGIYRKAPKGFVVQVTNPVKKRDDLGFCVKDMRDHGVEFIIAKLAGGYALFRKHIGDVDFVPEPSRDKWVGHYEWDGCYWVYHWCPDGENATGGG